MGQRWVTTSRSAALSARRSRDTAPEVELRRALHAAGARFRLQRRIAKGCTADLVLPRWRVAVFVDGDFWHGCPTHFPDRQPAGPNAALWQQKFARTQERDRKATTTAQQAGWTVIRLWECEISVSPADTAARVLAACGSRFRA